MRELKRSIARARMKEQGYTRINKRRLWKNNGTTTTGSFFSRNWRKFAAMDPIVLKKRRMRKHVGR